VAQYRKDQHTFLPNGNTIFEVAMSASEDGRLHANNNPTPSASLPWLWQIEKGNITGLTAVNVQGFNTAHPSSWRAVWELSNSVAYVFPSSALAMTFSSSSTETLTMTVQGLDENYAIKSATVTFTAGTTGTVTSGTSTFFRINKMQITSGTSVGNISATNTGTTYSYITAGFGQSQASVYTVPAGFTFFLNRVVAYTTNNGNQHCFYRIYTQKISGGITTPQIVLTASFTQIYTTLRVVPRAYTEKTDIQWQLNQSTAAPGSIQLEGILVNNTIV
jgi:hypothetical protein